MSFRTAASGLIVALAVVVSAGGCKKKDDGGEATKPAPAPAPAATGTPTATPTPTPTPTADGARKVPIEVVKDGYSPDRIPGKPGEKLTLVFTRKVDGHCYEEVKLPGGPKISLPKNEPVEVAVTVPQQGEVRFACGMDMLEGVIVADK